MFLSGPRTELTVPGWRNPPTTGSAAIDPALLNVNTVVFEGSGAFWLVARKKDSVVPAPKLGRGGTLVPSCLIWKTPLLPSPAKNRVPLGPIKIPSAPFGEEPMVVIPVKEPPAAGLKVPKNTSGEPICVKKIVLA